MKGHPIAARVDGERALRDLSLTCLLAKPFDCSHPAFAALTSITPRAIVAGHDASACKDLLDRATVPASPGTANRRPSASLSTHPHAACLGPP